MNEHQHHPFHNGNEEKFLKSMRRGNTYSRAQVKHIFKLKNPTAAVLRFEEAGWNIQREYFYDKKSKMQKVRYSL